MITIAAVHPSLRHVLAPLNPAILLARISGRSILVVSSVTQRKETATTIGRIHGWTFPANPRCRRSVLAKYVQVRAAFHKRP